MNDLIRSIVERNFSDLSGLVLTGSVPLREAFVNELLADALDDLSSEPPAPRPAMTERPLDLGSLVRLVTKASVRIEAGVITLDFEIRA